MEARPLPIVFILSAEFLEAEEAAKLLALNKFYLSRLETSSWKRSLVLSYLSSQLSTKVTEANYKALLFDVYYITAKNFNSAYQRLKGTSNLLKNSYGAQGLKYWYNEYYCSDFSVEPEPTFKGRSHAIVGLCDSLDKISQDVLVDVPKQKKGVASAFVAVKKGVKGGCMISAKVFRNHTLRGAYQTKEVKLSQDPADEGSLEWTRLSVKFPVRKGTTRIKVSIHCRVDSCRLVPSGCRIGHVSLMLV